MKLNIREIYDLIEGFYPGLVDVKKSYNVDRMYFKDSEIFDGWLIVLKRLKHYDLVGPYFILSLYFDLDPGINYSGRLFMQYNFELSNSTYLKLYNHNIKIEYKDEYSPKADILGYIVDHRDDVIRQWTIKNIINE